MFLRQISLRNILHVHALNIKRWKNMSEKAKKFLLRMQQKTMIVFLIAVVIFIVLVIRVAYIGIAKGEEYQEEVLDQKTYDSIDIPYERGDIVDRNGNVLATSTKVYNLILEPKNILKTEDGKNATKTALMEYFGVSEDEFDSYMEYTESFYKVAVKGLSYTEVKAFQDYCDTSEGADVTGVWFEEEYDRNYPNGTLACHILGYTVSGNVGQGGIEGYYNDYLNGVNGKTYGYLTTDNTVESVTVDAQDGYTVVSTIDLNIQKIIEDNINEYMETTGADKIGVIAMDPDTGEILGMATSYSYDPNNPMDTNALREMTVTVTREVSSETSEEATEEENTSEEALEEGSEDTEEATTEEVETEEVEYNFSEMTDEEFENIINSLSEEQRYEALNAVWRNFCISDVYEPGSTFKPFTVAGAVEEGVVEDGDTFYCDGYEEVADYTIYCHNRTGDGTLTLKQALEKSCNDCLMQIAALEGSETFAKYQSLFNFGSTTGIDLSGEASGLVYTEETLNSTELATSSFGQGVNVTMIQMAAAFCSVINGGNYYEPHVVKQIVDSDGSIIQDIEPELVRKTISKSTSDLLVDYLSGVVSEGTGTRAAVDGYTIGGKTGTAEKLPRGNGEYVLSFIGFSPVENPQIVVYVVVDSPNVADQSSSGAGTLLFHDIMEDLLPYMNIYQSSDETITDNGLEEQLSSSFEDSDTEEGEASEAETEEGETTEGETEESTEETTETTTEELPVRDE